MVFVGRELRRSWGFIIGQSHCVQLISSPLWSRWCIRLYLPLICGQYISDWFLSNHQSYFRQGEEYVRLLCQSWWLTHVCLYIPRLLIPWSSTSPNHHPRIATRIPAAFSSSSFSRATLCSQPIRPRCWEPGGYECLKTRWWFGGWLDNVLHGFTLFLRAYSG